MRKVNIEVTGTISGGADGQNMTHSLDVWSSESRELLERLESKKGLNLYFRFKGDNYFLIYKIIAVHNLTVWLEGKGLVSVIDIEYALNDDEKDELEESELAEKMCNDVDGLNIETAKRIIKAGWVCTDC